MSGEGKKRREKKGKRKGEREREKEKVREGPSLSRDVPPQHRAKY